MTHAPDNLIAAAEPRSVGTATVADAITPADNAAPSFVVELAADGNDPAEGPAAVRLKRWLKQAVRSHGLRAVSVAPVRAEPTAGLAVTNAPQSWRPTGRAIRRATAVRQGGDTLRANSAADQRKTAVDAGKGATS